ncbi:hypothetical protein [Embleya sp. NPDC020886]|uniref:hypothetical protein n=1 Tax=Embleya sp. NPDC020886 TaxID=3363980 RepID=UPI0037A03300
MAPPGSRQPAAGPPNPPPGVPPIQDPGSFDVPGRTYVEADALTRLAGTADGFQGEILKINRDADATAQTAAGGLEGFTMQAALRELAHDWPLQAASAAAQFTLAAEALRANADRYRHTEHVNTNLFGS